MQNEDWDEDDSDDWSDDFDYESFVEENFSDKMTNTETKPLWRLVSVVLLIAFAFSVFIAVMR